MPSLADIESNYPQKLWIRKGGLGMSEACRYGVPFNAQERIQMLFIGMQRLRRVLKRSEA